ncbi:MAG TPA: ankyrin repeat domain-containing protein [Gammaproteobacteria bacterium]|jgi:ankyrin repeat protein|nr:ankyrin repeat domain-containing protein [Gammaproteobacteria bacterium]
MQRIDITTEKPKTDLFVPPKTEGGATEAPKEDTCNTGIGAEKDARIAALIAIKYDDVDHLKEHLAKMGLPTINHNLKISLPYTYGLNLLHLAVREDAPNVARYLITECDADPYLHYAETDPQTAIDGDQRFCQTISIAPFNAIQVLLESPKIDVNRYTNGCSMLFFVLRRKDENLDVARLLLAKGADAYHITDNPHYSTIQEIAAWLLQKGKITENHYQAMIRLAVLEAIEKDEVSRLEYLLHGGIKEQMGLESINDYLPETPGKNLLHIAVIKQARQAVRLLIRKYNASTGVYEIDPRTHQNSFLPLHRAATFRYATFNNATFDNATIATINNDVLEELCPLGTAIDFNAFSNGKSALYYALESLSLGNFRFLIDKGADPGQITVDGSDSSTAQEFATKLSESGHIDEAMHHFIIVVLQGEAIKSNNVNRLRNLMINGDLKRIGFLTIDTPDCNGDTLLHKLVTNKRWKEGCEEMANFLITECGANVNAKTADHAGHPPRTALDFAVLGNDTGWAKCLLGKGADPQPYISHITDIMSFDEVATKFSKEMIILLLEHSKKPHHRGILLSVMHPPLTLSTTEQSIATPPPPVDPAIAAALLERRQVEGSSKPLCSDGSAHTLTNS